MSLQVEIYYMEDAEIPVPFSTRSITPIRRARPPSDCRWSAAYLRLPRDDRRASNFILRLPRNGRRFEHMAERAEIFASSFCQHMTMMS